MAEFELISVASGAVLSAILVILIIYYLPRLRRILGEQREAGEIVGMMLSELRQRLAQQDQRIMDHQVKLDVLELRVMKTPEEKREPPQASAGEMTHILEEIRAVLKEGRPAELTSVTQRDIRAVELPAHMIASALSPTETKVMELLREGPKTPKEIQKVIGRSREHTARLLKDLFESGYVVRQDVRRPFVYELSRKGREVV